MEHVAMTIAHMTAPAARTGAGHRSPLPDDACSEAARHAILSIRPDASEVRRVMTEGGACAAHDVYEDALGYVYRFDRADERLVAVDRTEDTDPKARQARAASRLTVGELRDRAVALIAAQRPSFARSRAEYHPLEGNRRKDLYLFRWEECVPASESDDGPFVEAALYADGTLARYADTLTTRR